MNMNKVNKVSKIEEDMEKNSVNVKNICVIIRHEITRVLTFKLKCRKNRTQRVISQQQ